MNRLLIFFALVIFSSTLNAQKIKEVFHPEQPTKERTDTTINGTDISWIFQTMPDKYVLQEFQEGNTLYKVNYRDSELKVVTPSVDRSFNKMTFQDSIGFEPEIFKMNFLGLEGFDERTSELQFFITVNKPDTDWTYPIYLYVNLDGSSRFELPTFDDDY